MITQKFYTELGKLLYALSKADGTIQKAEEKVIENLIKEEIWHHKEYFNKYPDSKEIILTKLRFFNAAVNNLSAKEAFESYKAFYKNYSDKLDIHHKELASTLVHRITASFKGTNKEERKLVDELIALQII